MLLRDWLHGLEYLRSTAGGFILFSELIFGCTGIFPLAMSRKKDPDLESLQEFLLVLVLVIKKKKEILTFVFVT